ncbi:MAG: sulfotransferase [Proteobacteria bacterium]|nr:sulfotransferase [Pseudomonadota bacterium]
MDFSQRLQQAHAALRAGNAATAERALRTLALEQPRQRECQWLLGAALLDLGRGAESIAVLDSLLAREPGFAPARIDLARARRQAGQPHEARAIVREVLQKSPHEHLAWLAYGDILVDLGQYDDAREAFERARLTDPQRPAIEQAGVALAARDWKRAEQLFRAILRGDPSHTAALCGLAAASLEVDRPHDAQRLLRHAQRRSAWLPLIHRGLAPALLQLGRLEEAGASARFLQRIEPQSAQTWVTSAGVAIRSLRQEEALSAYERAVQLRPADSGLRMSIGHVQKTLGDRAASEASYKAALAMDPRLGEAWWSLADLKNYSFADPELAEMQRLLAAGAGSGAAPLHFALGKAREQRGDYRGAFGHYARGNALRHAAEPFDIAAFEVRCGRIRGFFDHAFFAAHAGCGAPGAAPIFIVGLPRSGSTLLEQILASHSRVAGTMELPNILNIVAQLDDMVPARDGYPQALAHAAAAEFAALGRRYLQETAPLTGGRERFTDKLPNNFSHVGLIHAILPQATIIDARRHPMDACFSTFRQHFAEGQTFSRDLETLGRYYRCYLALMDHWDAVLPGKVLHVQYEDVVRAPEAQIRRLLAHCGLAFEPACLEFHATRRAVRTASAEQVRQPLYSSSVGYWRNFEYELEPLRRALGDDLRRFDGIAAADQGGG